MLRVILWPFWLVWDLVGLLFRIVGGILSVLLGIALVALGTVLTVTVIGAILGVPILFTGVLLILRAFF